MKTYKGARSPLGCVITVNDVPLDPRADLQRVSDVEFEWGYDGTGPRRLALAVLADYLGDDQKALDFHQVFTETVIAELKGDEWTLTGEQVQSTLDQVAVVPMDLKTLLERVRGRRPE
ncbi:MAG: DUF6166 domain-containing protein [Alphaproteobacteria bacterium]